MAVWAPPRSPWARRRPVLSASPRRSTKEAPRTATRASWRGLPSVPVPGRSSKDPHEENRAGAAMQGHHPSFSEMNRGICGGKDSVAAKVRPATRPRSYPGRAARGNSSFLTARGLVCDAGPARGYYGGCSAGAPETQTAADGGICTDRGTPFRASRLYFRETCESRSSRDWRCWRRLAISASCCSMRRRCF